MDWKKESEMFNRMADYYDKYRPGYPKDIVGTIIGKANLSAWSKVLEIGAGSGKATSQFADCGFEMLCVDPGEDLVRIGNERFADKNIRFVVSRFEDYPAPSKYFDAIISAQAFHWLPQPSGYEKCAETLRDGGCLAAFWNIELIQRNDFDDGLLAILHKYNAFTSAVSEEDYKKRVEGISAGFTDSGYFQKPEVIHSRWEKDHTVDDYFGLLLTGNVFVQNPDEVKQACYDELKKLAARYNGKIRRNYICELYITRTP